MNALGAVIPIPSYTPPRKIKLKVLVNGVATASKKGVYIYRGPFRVAAPLTLSEAVGDGYSYDLMISEQRITDDPIFSVLVAEYTGTKKFSMQPLDLSTETQFTVNIADGSGGGEQTTDATVEVSVTVDKLPSSRQAVALERKLNGDWRIAGHINASADGPVTMPLKIVDGAIFAVALDDYGQAFAPSLAVTVGHRIRPSVFAGWLYEITEAGTLPAQEPAWWAAEGDNPSQPLGTARAIAVRYYQPLAHGPVPVVTL